MTDDEFRAFCYDQYKLSLSQNDELYRRAGLLLTALTVLGGATMALFDRHLLPDLLNTVRPLYWLTLRLYLAFLALAGVALVVSVIVLILTLLPRRYFEIAPLKAWLGWRDEYRQQLGSVDSLQPDHRSAAVAQATHDAVVRMLSEAQGNNSRLNSVRLRWFRRSVWFTIVLAASLTLSALARLVLILGT